MGLLEKLLKKHLLIEAKLEQILTKKMGLPMEFAEYLKNTYSKKNVIFFANILKTSMDNEAYGHVYDTANDMIKYSKFEEAKLKQFEEYMKHEKLPLVTKENKDGILGSEHPINLVNRWNHRYTEVLDYVTATNRNLRNTSLTDAVRASREWHSNMKSGRGSIQTEEGQVIIHVFKDGYYWIDLKMNYCEKEGSSMGHCGRTSADTLLSLRDPDNVPHVTVAYNYNTVYRQMKGAGNKLPHQKYWDYCMWLFDHKEVDGVSSTERKSHPDVADDYIITDRLPEYAGYSDFTLQDYYDVDVERVSEILEESPELDNGEFAILDTIRKKYKNMEIPDKISKEDAIDIFEKIDLDITVKKNGDDDSIYVMYWFDVDFFGTDFKNAVSSFDEFDFYDFDVDLVNFYTQQNIYGFGKDLLERIYNYFIENSKHYSEDFGTSVEEAIGIIEENFYSKWLKLFTDEEIEKMSNLENVEEFYKEFTGLILTPTEGKSSDYIEFYLDVVDNIDGSISDAWKSAIERAMRDAMESERYQHIVNFFHGNGYNYHDTELTDSGIPISLEMGYTEKKDFKDLKELGDKHSLGVSLKNVPLFLDVIIEVGYFFFITTSEVLNIIIKNGANEEIMNELYDGNLEFTGNDYSEPRYGFDTSDWAKFMISDFFYY